MDNVEGINIESAKNSIMEYYNVSKAVLNNLYDVASNFLYGLKEVWASPNAVDFSQKFQNATSSLSQSFKIKVNHTLIGLFSAGAAICNAHGVAHEWHNAGLDGLNVGDESFAVYGQVCEEKRNGTTGMVVQNVKLLVDELNNNIKQLSNSLNDLPSSVAFYSADGSLISSYQTGKEQFVEAFSRLFEQTNTKINEYIETETDNILIASSTAFSNIEESSHDDTDAILNTENFF